MRKVKDILKEKGYTIYSISPDVFVYDAIHLMCEKNIGGLLVVENNSLVGIFTERDYARKLILKGKSSKKAVLRDIMTPKVFTVSSEDTVEYCMQLMTRRKIRHLPVVDNGVLTGLVSIGDAVRFVINEQKDIIEHLEHYIAGQ